jgi:hypothetical protein
VAAAGDVVRPLVVARALGREILSQFGVVVLAKLGHLLSPFPVLGGQLRRGWGSAHILLTVFDSRSWRRSPREGGRFYVSATGAHFGRRVLAARSQIILDKIHQTFVIAPSVLGVELLEAFRIGAEQPQPFGQRLNEL